MKNKEVKIRNREYIVENCPSCGHFNLVRKEDSGRWMHCVKCSGNSYYTGRP